MPANLQLPPAGQQDKGPTFLAIALVFTVIALFFVVTRVYVRVWLRRAFGWDDGMIVLAMILAVVSTGFNVPEVLVGYGQHRYYLSDGNAMEALKWNYLATPLLVFSLAASKISICLLLLRILNKIQGKFKQWFPHAIIVILIAIAVPSAGYSLGQCQPVRKLWNPSTPGHCQDPSIFVKVGYANGVINATCDFALALFPLSFIKDLHLQTRRKVILGVLMCCGVICGMLAITRTILTGDLTIKSDVTYDSVNSSILALVEENVSIIVSCVPTLGPIYQLIDEKIKSLKSSQHSTKQNHKSYSEHHRSTTLPLHVLSDTRGVTRYETSAAATKDTYKSEHGSYGSLGSLVPGIQRTTEVDIQRSEV